MNRITTIYTLADPRDSKIRYVGKTVSNLSKRLCEHICDSAKRRNHRNNWIQSLLKIGLVPIIEIVDEVSTLEWEQYEIYWIEQFKAWGFDLTNQCAGGRGAIGIKRSSEYIKKLKQRMTGRKMPLRTIQKLKNANEYKRKSVLQYDLNKNLINEFTCIMEAERQLKIKNGNISLNCQGKRKTAGGYIWKYKQ